MLTFIIALPGVWFRVELKLFVKDVVYSVDSLMEVRTILIDGNF